MIRLYVSKFDKDITRLIAHLPESWRPFFELISYIGHPVTTSSVGLLVVMYGIFKHKPMIALTGTFVWLALLISTGLKILIERARPLTDYVAGMHIPSFSFPSGHTTGSTIAFGLLAFYSYYLLPRPFNYICLAVFSLLILLVGISRVYLGAHYPTDVIGGWILGGVILCVVIFVIKPLQ